MKWLLLKLLKILAGDRRLVDGVELPHGYSECGAVHLCGVFYLDGFFGYYFGLLVFLM